MEERNYLAGIKFSQENINAISQYFCNDIDVDGEFCTCDNSLWNNDESIKVQRIGKTTLTGDEDWYFDEKSSTYYYYQFNKYNEYISGIHDQMSCTHFRWTKHNNDIRYGEFQGDIDNKIMFKFDAENIKGGDIENFKNWLRDQYLNHSPVEVYFILQYPELSYSKNNYMPYPSKPQMHQLYKNTELKPQIHCSQFIKFDELIK